MAKECEGERKERVRDVQEEGEGEQEAWDVDTVSITLKMCAVAHPARVVLVCGQGNCGRLRLG